jgi:dTMP kinase
VIEPALARGAIVITDRYVDSFIAFQSVSQALSTDELSVLTQWATHALLPDVTVLLDLPAEIVLRRARMTAYPDPPPGPPGPPDGPAEADDAGKLTFQGRVRDTFRRLAQKEPDRYLPLDATRSPEEIHAEIRSFMASRIDRPAVLLGVL